MGYFPAPHALVHASAKPEIAETHLTFSYLSYGWSPRTVLPPRIFSSLSFLSIPIAVTMP